MKKSEDHRSYQELPRPVGAMAKSYPAGYAGYVHSHPRGQFLYAESGTMKVTTDHGSWVIPPHRAVWLPPNYPHQTSTLSAIEMRTLYILPDACPELAPPEPRVIQVSPLLRELVRRATALPVDYDEGGHDGRVIALLMEEINWDQARSVTLPVLRDTRLLSIEQELSAKPGDSRTLEQWAAFVGAAPRTLTRLLLRETGMSFRSWRDQVRTLAALPRLLEGVQVTILAIEFGYETPGAFAAMFKRVMGITPSQYIQSCRSS